MPAAAEAEASVICNGEHELGNESLFLLEEPNFALMRWQKAFRYNAEARTK